MEAKVFDTLLDYANYTYMIKKRDLYAHLLEYTAFSTMLY